PFRIRAAAALALSHDLQQRIDKNALCEADSLFDRYSSPGMWTWFGSRLSSLEHGEGHAERRRAAEAALFSILDRLEVLRDDWKPYLTEARRTLKTPLPSRRRRNVLFPNCLPNRRQSSF
ncbi:MAG TPA: hypothetical protein H9911_08935, partial [Candidatus Mediterraneibacter tabaqchaliae]|nr:hypothetical protein [Candidatus Mediterraneibacter tabaqchaliae]